MADPIKHFYAVVPAGGAGTRLWPLSRATAPKFLRDLTGLGRTMLQDTIDRLEPLAEDRFLVVTGAAHAAAVRGQLPELGPEAVVAEPSARDSMAAIGYAAAILERRDPEAIMGSFAADHVIQEPHVFRRTVVRACDLAMDDWLVTIGVEPTFPSSAFGYLHMGDPIAGYAGGFRVQSFVEKPSEVVARRYVSSGEHKWNAGMFVARPRVVLELLEATDPDFAAALRALAAAPETIEEVWPTLPKIAVDHAVAEPAADAGRVATVPASFGWDDIGDFDSLAALLGAGTARAPRSVPVVLGDEQLVHSIHSTGLVVPASGKTVTVVGIDDVVVIDTPDALLVTTRQRAQDVKAIVNLLKESGNADLT